VIEYDLLPLSSDERKVLQDALSAYVGRSSIESGDARALIAKLRNATAYPSITVGVYGGIVQWVLGNPFPIRICDYDGEIEDLPDVDERGQPCRIGYAPPDVEDSNLRT